MSALGLELKNDMSLQFQEHFRCPDAVGAFQVSNELSPSSGFFRFGSDVTCYGQAAGVRVASSYLDSLEDCSAAIAVQNGHIQLPFDPDLVVRNLRNEVYTRQMDADVTKLGSHPTIRTMYYWGRPFLPVPMRSVLQRFYLRGETANPFPVWPVDRTVDTLLEKLMTLAVQNAGGRPVPFIWFWPEGATAAFILTHDVESQMGRDYVPSLMDFDDQHGFKASFQFVPEKRYELPDGFLASIKTRGFEVNVHDLNHDGNLFRERKEFLRRAETINAYVREFGAQGFRSGALYRNPSWYGAFDFAYDMSIPNVAHLDPQGGGCCTTFPYFVGDVLEIPVTCTQDYSLFHILNQFSIDLWKRQFEKIVNGHGMISLIVHPDYVVEQRARETVGQMLDFVTQQYLSRGLWATVPAEINRWWRQRHSMRLVAGENGWRIDGEGKERAAIAYARLVDGHLTYSFDRDSADHDGSTIRISAQPPSASSDWRSDSAPSARATHAFSTASAIAEPDAPEVISEPAAPVVTKVVPHRPLRVAMVAYTFYESDNRVMRYAETLAKRGDHVDIYALRRGDLPDNEVISGVHVHRLQGRLVNERNRFSYFWRLTMFFLRAFLQVSRSDAREKCDLFHVHSVPDFLVFTTLIPRLRGTPVILDIHDILPEFYASKFGTGQASFVFKALLGIERASTRFASHVIIANHIWQDRIAARSVPPEKVSVVLNSPDRSIFTRSAPPSPGPRFTILYPGSLNWHQGLDILIRAFDKIKDKVPNADLYIYGDGPAKPGLIQLTQERGLENRVFLPNARPLREIAKIIECADLGVVPKRKDNFGNEAFSTKILEFMAMGVPVIVSDTKVDRYYFNDSVVRFFRGGDDAHLAECMLDLITNASLRQRQTENASRFVETVDWNAKQHEYLELVDALAARKLRS